MLHAVCPSVQFMPLSQKEVKISHLHVLTHTRSSVPVTKKNYFEKTVCITDITLKLEYCLMFCALLVMLFCSSDRLAANYLADLSNCTSDWCLYVLILLPWVACSCEPGCSHVSKIGVSILPLSSSPFLGGSPLDLWGPQSPAAKWFQWLLRSSGVWQKTVLKRSKRRQSNTLNNLNTDVAYFLKQ